MDHTKENSVRVWVLASRPKTLVGALIPVAIATSLAYTDGVLNWIPALLCTVFACLMQISANLINDLFDYRKGADKEDRIGPERALAQGWISPKAMKAGIVIVMIAACIAGSFLLFYGGWWLIFVGIVCLIFAYLYTGGPYPLAYYGWGDLLVILFFGFVPVCGTYYVQALHITPSVLVASLISGLVIDTMLIANNYRDRETDKASGKKTVIVRLGELFGRYFYLLAGVVASLLCLYFLKDRYYAAALLPQLYLIPHLLTWNKMVRIRNGKELNVTFVETARNMLLFGILVSAGLWLS